MGIAQIPASSGGLSSVVKSVQRGSAASAGNITITAVDISKTLVNSFSTSSSGTVAASGSINAASGSASAQSGTSSAMSGSGNAGIFLGMNTNPNSTQLGTGGNYTYSNRYGESFGPFAGASANLNMSNNAQNVNLNAQNISLNATNLTGGTTNLVAGVNGAYLSNSTTLVVTGPCRYEVVEYF